LAIGAMLAMVVCYFLTNVSNKSENFDNFSIIANKFFWLLNILMQTIGHVSFDGDGGKLKKIHFYG